MQALLNLLKRSKVVLIIITLLVISYVVYFIATYSTTTDNAYVTARMSYVSTPISGIIDKIYVSDHQAVHEGQLLLTLDPRQYEYALNIAKSKLAELEISLKIKAVDIINLKKAIEVAQSDFNFQKDRYNGAQQLNTKEVIATLKYDQIKNDYLKAEYLMEQAQQNLQNAELEQANIHNKIDEASNSIKLAEYNLKSTKIYAPTSGIVTNLTMIKGSPVAAYKSIITLIDTSSWWVQANFQETDLANVKAGDKAKIRLRMYLGDKVYQGTVENANWAVGRRVFNSADLLQAVPQENQWLLLPQRFPVLIKIDHPDPDFPLHVGASAYVTIETSK